MNKLDISFFCPAYNDEQNLPRLIPEVVQVLSESCGQFDITIIEDGSPDKTNEAADELSKKYPNIRVIHHPKNLGYGATIGEGFHEANKYEWTFYTDGDRQYNVFELKDFLANLNDADAIIGYRKSRALSGYRKFQSNIYNFIIKLLFGINFKDIDCSMKLVRREILSKFSLNSTSALIDAELLIKIKRNGGKIIELPVTHMPREFGEASGAKPAIVFKTIWEMLKLRLGLL